MQRKQFWKNINDLWIEWHFQINADFCKKNLNFNTFLKKYKKHCQWKERNFGCFLKICCLNQNFRQIWIFVHTFFVKKINFK